MTRTGITAQSYLNGVTCLTAGASVGSGTVGFRLGHNTDGGAFYYAGKILDVQISNYILTSTEITSIVNAGPLGSNLELPTIAGSKLFDAPLTNEFTQSATVANDVSRYSQNLVATGTPPTFDFDGVVLNGVNDFVDGTPIDISADGTISVWFNADDTTSTQILLGNVSASGNRDYIIANGDQVDTCTFAAGTWNNLIMTRTGITAQSYLNGVTCLTAGASVASGTVGLTIGKNTGGTERWFAGTITKVQIFGEVLSSFERVNIVNEGHGIISRSFSTTAGGIVLDVPLDDEHSRSATVANDLSPYAAIGTASGTPAPTYGASGVTLDGIDQVVTILNPDDGRYTPGDGAGTDGVFSMCANVNRGVAGSIHPILARRTGATAATMEWQFLFNSLNSVSCTLYSNGASHNISAASSNSEAPYVGITTRYCCVYDGSESELGLSVWRNGEDITNTQTETGTYTGLTARAVPLEVGSSRSIYFFEGTLSDSVIWRKELTPAEVLADTNEHQ
jgi:hypothetical protein